MYSVAAWPPCQPRTTNVKARPMPIHTADSMAASFVEGAWGRRWTTSRSMISRAVTNARKATHTHTGTSKVAKLPSSDDEDSDASTARDGNTSYLRLRATGPTSRRSRPPQGPQSPGRGTVARPEAVLTMITSRATPLRCGGVYLPDPPVPNPASEPRYRVSEP